MITIFTPLSKSGNPYISEVYASLRAQTLQDFEWVVLPNNGGFLPASIREDPRVRVINHAGETGIGAIKKRCCTEASGDFLIELDHDDVIREDTIEKVAERFAGGADFVFSDFCEFKHVGLEPNPYNGYGWKSYDVEFRGKTLRAMRAPDDLHSKRRIEWAPNHVRAWRRETYDKLGGHNESMPVADDHDLVLRTFLSGAKMEHIPECLYFYRVHKEQTVQKKNALIQELDWRVYETHIEKLALTFASMNGLKAIDLCGGINPRDGFTPLDKSLGHDLDRRWPLEDSSVGVLRAHDAIEHLRDPVHTMNEAWRVLAPGGFFVTLTPSTDGRGAFQDPTHVSFWNANSFWYYTNQNLQRYVPAIKARFQVSRIRDIFPTPWHEANRIPYVEAHLIALKDGYSPMGEVNWSKDQWASTTQTDDRF